MEWLAPIQHDPAPFRHAVASRSAYRPLYVKIKLTFACNLRCAMCRHWREERPPPLPLTHWQHLIDDLAALGCRKLHFSGGEPLLAPYLPDLVAQATRLGIRVTLTTNGTLLEKTLARHLVEAGLRGVNISLDSPIRKIHDRLRGVPGAWKATLRGVRHIVRAAPRGKISIRLNTVVSRGNYRSLLGLPDLAADLGVAAINLIAVDAQDSPGLALRQRDLRDYNARIAPHLAQRGMQLGLIQHPDQVYVFGNEDADSAHALNGHYARGFYQQHPCYAPWVHSLIDFNGRVYLCCMTRENMPPLGDLTQQRFSQIWQGAAYSQARQMMHPPTLPQCQCCDNFIAINQALQPVY
ncbi:elongator protein 3/MiaB/NifB, putative [Oscillochloris trichoides DG-6]|uniref:Elongator protein 3/MiaB/NifB, putative n=1 Tax=Oscillochloris trichoides DG-6 TaxID=765420 RepID=E1IED7_9CHLR|nr:radical SAM protein [Oscillochloris trichoides]EFO80463.1 elongator protein 3/MiaB/NifB, putative [Oscillochloris trichoides DG-6]